MLLFFAAHPSRSFTPEEIVVAMRPVVITMTAARQYAALFVAHRLVAEMDGRYRYAPSSSQLEHCIGELTCAYNERPVTLIRAIYRIAEVRVG
jgi:hypothetical protein